MTNNCKISCSLANPLKYEICNSIIILYMAERKLIQTVAIVYNVYSIVFMYSVY